MLDPNEDELIPALQAARNRVLYDKYKNSLVEWTLSKSWTKIKPSGVYRGCRTRPSGLQYANIFAGEISL